MKKLMLAGVAVVLFATGIASAQTKVLTGETRTVRYSVEAINTGTREVTVKKADGTYEVLYVPNTVKRFDTLKVGDQISVQHYENIILQMKTPGSKDVDTSARNTATPGPQGGTLANQRTITATIAAIDPKVPSVTFTGPGGYKYTTRVEDKAALAKVKVGDKLDITWTEAVIVSIDDVK